MLTYGSYFIVHITLTASELCWLQLREFCGFTRRQLQWQSADSWKTRHSCLARMLLFKLYVCLAGRSLGC